MDSAQVLLRPRDKPGGDGLRSDQRSFIPPPSGVSVPFQELLETPLNISSGESKSDDAAPFRLSIDIEKLERAAEKIERSQQSAQSEEGRE